MELRKEILKEHSKAQCNAIVHRVGGSQEKFDELFHLFLHGDRMIAQRASWPVGYCVAAHPHFIDKHWKPFIENLRRTDLHDAVKRNSVKMLQFLTIPKKYQGDVMDTCFGFLEKPGEAVAVKVFSMTVLQNLSRHYPDIIPEIRLLIESQLADQTAGFKSRAKHCLKQLAKQ